MCVLRAVVYRTQKQSNNLLPWKHNMGDWKFGEIARDYKNKSSTISQLENFGADSLDTLKCQLQEQMDKKKNVRCEKCFCERKAKLTIEFAKAGFPLLCGHRACAIHVDLQKRAW